MTELTSDIENVLIQIATPWGTGFGFYLHDNNLIVTDLSMVDGALEMVVSGKLFPKTLTKRLFADSQNNLAFIEAPEGIFLPKVDLTDIYSAADFDEKYRLLCSIDLLKKIVNKYKEFNGAFVVACPECANFITTENINDNCCSDCGVQIPKEIFDGKQYQPSATGKKIEEIIGKLNYEVPITRIGKNYWEIDEGSALICIEHNTDKRFVKAYAVLCKLSEKKVGSIYEYLLKENNYLKGLSFSVVEQEVLLSMMHVSEDDLHIESAIRLFKSLLNKADDYDDVLIEMGAMPLHDED